MIEISSKADCCGCAACMNVCPNGSLSLIRDEFGCEYPNINLETCIECGQCEKVCPILNSSEEIPTHQRAFLIQHKDPTILGQSTSGGAFSALAEEVLGQGGLVFGHGYNGEIESRAPEVHCFSVNDREQLSLFRNSKYSQSTIGYSLKNVKEQLRKGTIVLFSGTPCQTEGLLKYLGHKPENLILVDVVCRAVPVRQMFEKYCNWLQEEYGKSVHSVRFRDKRKYGYRYSNICAFQRNDESPFYSAGVESDPMLRAFFSNICDRPSCYECKFKKRYRPVDLTLWDCFDIYELDRSLDNNLGVTRVLVHTDKGADMMQSIRQYALVIEIDVEEAIRNSREMTNSVSDNTMRQCFLEDLRELNSVELIEKWFPDNVRVKAERAIRKIMVGMGIYDKGKRVAKRLLKNFHRR
ncbi:Coenzyme F420 hydrogenase/dehydrogenase, beta subunit C-terminal domain [Anaerotardibacter muris]|uniref:Coenzyme F420 hydrogenase/dehydrogenase, beta subunit C-terminal domain n=1 Tax=Anaerotardibacter muris TaxID=2941505 RepID=UPI00203F32B5|nr:Coenzyme F420 hydrogenase/dehydrogenase, beta subunit C-terminal domain [Anaerotardibacter muris]